MCIYIRPWTVPSRLISPTHETIVLSLFLSFLASSPRGIPRVPCEGSRTEQSDPFRSEGGREPSVRHSISSLAGVSYYYFNKKVLLIFRSLAVVPCPPEVSVQGVRRRSTAQTSGLLCFPRLANLHDPLRTAQTVEGGSRRAWAREGGGPVVYTRGIEYPRM